MPPFQDAILNGSLTMRCVMNALRNSDNQKQYVVLRSEFFYVNLILVIIYRFYEKEILMNELC